MRAKKKNIKNLEKFADPNTQLRLAREELSKAEKLRTQKSLDKAEIVCTGLLRKYPDYYGALHTLGLIYADKGSYQRAVHYLVQAAIQNPSSWPTHTALAGCYLKLDSKDMAAHALKQAIDSRPDDPNVLLTLAQIYFEDRKYELSFKTFEKAFEIAPHIKEAALGIATSGLELGQYEKVVAALQYFLNQGNLNLQCLFLLSQLPNQYCDMDVIKLFDKLELENSAENITGSLFIRSRALDNSCHHDQAWTSLVEANKMKRSELSAAKLQSELSTYSQRLDWLKNNPHVGKGRKSQSDSEYISLFILGPSRSGKTVVEALLGAHSRVRRGYEDPSVRDAIKQTYMDAGLLNWASVQNLPINFRDKVRLNHERLIRSKPSDFDVITNTSPGLIWDALNLSDILGNSKFVFLDREFYDLAFRIFMKEYRNSHHYSYDLKSIENFIGIYNEMMSLVSQRVPEHTLILKYNEVVENPRETFTKLVKFCGLEIESVDLPSIGDDRHCSDPYRQQMDILLRE